jgi:uncharacterized protein YbjT (DUF2867 family)
MNNSLIFGSTGFIGTKVVSHLKNFEGSTISISRKKNLDFGSLVNQIIVEDFNLKNIDLPKIDHVFICLGTKLRAWELIFMSKEKKDIFIKTDLDLIINAAKKAKASGAKTISLVSAVGVKEGSLNTYMDIKGKVENEIIKLEFESTNFFRPGHLQGKASSEKWDTAVADFFSKIMDVFLVGPFTKFKSIEGDSVAKAMVNETLNSKPGINIFYFKEMIQSFIRATPSE